MINKSQLALIATLAAISFASPAFAQALNKGDGTGSVSTFAYGPGGSKPTYEPGPARLSPCSSADRFPRLADYFPAPHTVQFVRTDSGLRTSAQGLCNYVGAPFAGEWDSNSNQRRPQAR